MECASIEPAIKHILAEIHSKLDEAARIAKAAMPAPKAAQSLRASSSPWISNN